MTDPSIDFASLLCSRLCHDLLSPVGAMNNGLELLADEDDPAMRARCMELLADSARSAAERLKFFRIAFGAAGGFGETVDAREVRAAIEGLLHGNSRVTLAWSCELASLPLRTAKILLNLAMIAIEALVRGGSLAVAVEGGEIGLRAEGLRLVLDTDVRAALLGAIDRSLVTSRTSAAWLVHSIADDAGGRIVIADGEEGVLVLGAALPG